MQDYFTRFRAAWTIFKFGVPAFLVVMFPGVGVVAAAVYFVLRKWLIDRLIAGLMFIVCLPAAALFVELTEYKQHWYIAFNAISGEPTPASGWRLVVVAGFVFGPMVGATIWRIDQERREREPFEGRDVKASRKKFEHERRRRVTNKAQECRHAPEKGKASKAFGWLAGVPDGDEKGPYLGLFQEGDMKRKVWRAGASYQYVRFPMFHTDNRHGVFVGATGLGKTEAILDVIEWGAKHDKQIVFISGKEPPSIKESVVPRMAAIADKYDLDLKVLSPLQPFDPMRGSLDEIRDKLIRIEEWGDSYWAHCANLLVGLALELNEAAGKNIDNLPDLVFSLMKGKLKDLASNRKGNFVDSRVSELIDAIENHAVSGALIRYASMSLHLRQWIAPERAGGWSYDDADISCIELPTTSHPEAAKALMRLTLRDLNSYIGNEERRQKNPDGSLKEIVVVIEEVGAVFADPVIGKENVNSFERNRAAGAMTLLSGQGLLGLGDEQTRAALLTNATLVSWNVPKDVEEVAELAGTERLTEGGADYRVTKYEQKGVARRQFTYKINPQILREMKLGEFVMIKSGKWLKAAETRTKLGYELPNSQAVREAKNHVSSIKEIDKFRIPHLELEKVIDLDEEEDFEINETF